MGDGSEVLMRDEDVEYVAGGAGLHPHWVQWLAQRVLDLKAEVAQLKAQLAKQQPVVEAAERWDREWNGDLTQECVRALEEAVRKAGEVE